MPRVNANPAALRRLAGDLNRFQEKVDTALRDIERQFRATEWDDAERARFEQALKEFTGAIRRVLTKTGPMRTTLIRKAQDLEHFLGSR